MELTQCGSNVCVCQSLRDDHAVILREADLFYEALDKLRYEGRYHQRANISAVSRSLSVLRKHLLEHIEIEEKKIFPLLVSFLPRLEAMTHLLYFEHGDFRDHLKAIHSSLAKFKISRTPMAPLSLHTQGMYLVCLLRSHFRIETQSVYMAIHNDLRAEEKKRLSEDCQAEKSEDSNSIKKGDKGV
ncbi:MAG: hemerythrin domain-containing protein [Candidatus Omnitrophica bacterium]|nr:hemerythrin domain-containing protein [Candidatus Omnitrophota bacterium]